jgi:hypothetical protein
LSGGARRAGRGGVPPPMTDAWLSMRVGGVKG